MEQADKRNLCRSATGPCQLHYLVTILFDGIYVAHDWLRGRFRSLPLRNLLTARPIHLVLRPLRSPPFTLDRELNYICWCVHSLPPAPRAGAERAACVPGCMGRNSQQNHEEDEGKFPYHVQAPKYPVELTPRLSDEPEIETLVDPWVYVPLTVGFPGAAHKTVDTRKTSPIRNAFFIMTSRIRTCPYTVKILLILIRNHDLIPPCV